MFKALLRAIFYPMPKVGGRYCFDNPNLECTVKVLEVNDKNIKFERENFLTFKEDTLDKSTFNYCYKKCKE